MVVEKLDSLYECLYQKGEIINSSGISFELSSEDGSSWKDSDLNSEITYVHVHIRVSTVICLYIHVHVHVYWRCTCIIYV